MTPPEFGLDDRYDLVSDMVGIALRRGYTQQQLADLIGVSRRSVHAWLHKRSLPTDEHYATIRKLVRPSATFGRL